MRPVLHPHHLSAPLETSSGERLLTLGLLAWVAARAAGERPHEQVLPAIAGRTTARAAALFGAWAQAAEAACVEPLRGCCAHCGGAGSDVQRLVFACGLAPVDLDAGARLLTPIVSDAEAVMVLGRSLNAELARAGWPLPARLASCAGPRRGSRRLH